MPDLSLSNNVTQIWSSLKSNLKINIKSVFYQSWYLFFFMIFFFILKNDREGFWNVLFDDWNGLKTKQKGSKMIFFSICYILQYSTFILDSEHSIRSIYWNSVIDQSNSFLNHSLDLKNIENWRSYENFYGMSSTSSVQKTAVFQLPRWIWDGQFYLLPTC